MKYTANILEPVLYKEVETPEYRLTIAEAEIKKVDEKVGEIQTEMQMTIAELTMLIASTFLEGE